MNSETQHAEYDVVDICNKCGGVNEHINPSYEGGILMETATKCEHCGFEDYWAFGYFESGGIGLDKSKKYFFDKEGIYHEK